MLEQSSAAYLTSQAASLWPHQMSVEGSGDSAASSSQQVSSTQHQITTAIQNVNMLKAPLTPAGESCELSDSAVSQEVCCQMHAQVHLYGDSKKPSVNPLNASTSLAKNVALPKIENSKQSIANNLNRAAASRHVSQSQTNLSLQNTLIPGMPPFGGPVDNISTNFALPMVQNCKLNDNSSLDSAILEKLQQLPHGWLISLAFYVIKFHYLLQFS